MVLAFQVTVTTSWGTKLESDHILKLPVVGFRIEFCGEWVEQEQVEEMKKKEERLEKQMTEVMSENKKLTDPLQKANNDVDELRRQLSNYDKDKQLLVVS